MPAPMPFDAPVTTATLPVSFCAIGAISLRRCCAVLYKMWRAGERVQIFTAWYKMEV